VQRALGEKEISAFFLEQVRFLEKDRVKGREE
jgi:hypothetical protein